MLLRTLRLRCELQVSLDDQAFNKQQTLRYVKGYAHQAPEMTVLDPPAMAGTTDMYRAGTYNPATYTNSVSYSGSPTLRGSGNSETLPEWVVNNNKVCVLASFCLPALLLMFLPRHHRDYLHSCLPSRFCAGMDTSRRL